MTDNLPEKQKVIILGAGPTGLAAAHESLKHNRPPLILEKDETVGGISRTVKYKNYLFDIGGHRFFTKMDNVKLLWQEMIGNDFLTVKRISRIYYRDKFYDYPLKPRNLFNFSPREAFLIVASYLKRQFRPLPREDNFEQWVVNRFGGRLYRTFFKSYTEKVWGIPCHQLQADWAAQRIKNLSLKSAAVKALFGTGKAKTLIESFNYPRKGPGMMWERFHSQIAKQGGEIQLNSPATRLIHKNGRITRVIYKKDGIEREKKIQNESVISTIPITHLIKALSPSPPEEVWEAARGLSYRSFLIVGLIVNKENIFPDQWIYVNCPKVKVGRIQNFKNWSAAMVPDPRKSSIGMEYFCTIGDKLWQTEDTELIDLATRELFQLGLVEEEDVVDGTVIRQPLAYPIYDDSYNRNLDIIRSYLEGFSNLQTAGRNGMHRYNNMDHSMQAGIQAAQNILGSSHNLWEIEEEPTYLEEEKPENASASSSLPKILTPSFINNKSSGG